MRGGGGVIRAFVGKICENTVAAGPSFEKNQKSISDQADPVEDARIRMWMSSHRVD